MDDAPDLTQNVISLTLAELIKTKAKDKTPDEQTAVTAEDVKSAPEPEPEKPKTKIVKRTTVKAENKPVTGNKTTIRVNTTEKEEKPANEPERGKSEEKQKLLSDDPEI